MKNDQLYPESSREMSEKRAALAPEISEAFVGFSKAAFKEGALSEKTKRAFRGRNTSPICARTLLQNSLVSVAALRRSAR